MPDFYIFTAEAYSIDTWGSRSAVAETKIRCIAKVEGKQVAIEVCRALELTFQDRRYASPKFFPIPVDKMSIAEAARWEVRISELRARNGRADDDNEPSRNAAYHHYAGKLEAQVRKRLGLPEGNETAVIPPNVEQAPAEEAEESIGTDEADTVKTKGRRKPPDSQLAPCRLKAKAVYEWAMSTIAGADTMTIPDLYSAILDKLDAMIAKANGPEADKLQSFRDSMPPNAETFGKYLRDAGVKRYNTEGKPFSSPSARRSNQI